MGAKGRGPCERMTRSRQIAVGGVALLSGQLVVALSQIIYSGFVSRSLPASAFGAFSVAISATGFAALLLTSGLAAFVVSRKDLSASHASWLWILSVLAGALGAVLLYSLAPLWAAAWGADESTPMTRVLSLQVLVAAPAALQAALLRREGRPAMDALTQVSAALAGMTAGGILVATSRHELALAVSPTVAASSTLLLATLLRRRKFGFARPGGARLVLGYSWRVSAQGIGFFLFLSAPVWVVSVTANAAELGQFSRAALVAGLPSTAIATALVRAAQPFYRRLESPAVVRRAVTDAAVLSSLIAFPIFAGIAAVGRPLVQAWLGPGWETAGRLVAPLALGYGLYAVFTVMANAAETLGQFRAIRNSQIAMLLPVGSVAAVALVTGQEEYGAWLTLPMAAFGLVALTFWLSRAGVVDWRALVRGLTLHACWAGAIAGAALTAQHALDRFGDPGAVALLALSVLSGVLLGLALLPRAPGWRILAGRQLVPRRLQRHG